MICDLFELTPNIEMDIDNFYKNLLLKNIDVIVITNLN